MKRLFVILFAIVLFAFPAFGCNSSEKKEENKTENNVILSYNGDVISLSVEGDEARNRSLNASDLSITTTPSPLSSSMPYYLTGERKDEFLSLLFSDGRSEYNLTLLDRSKVDASFLVSLAEIAFYSPDGVGFNFNIGKKNGKICYMIYNNESNTADYYCADYGDTEVFYERDLIQNHW